MPDQGVCDSDAICLSETSNTVRLRFVYTSLLSVVCRRHTWLPQIVAAVGLDFLGVGGVFVGHSGTATMISGPTVFHGDRDGWCW